MNRRKKLKVPFSRTKYDESKMAKLRQDIQRAEAIRCETYEMYRKRVEFEFDQLQKAYRLSHHTISYLKNQGMHPLRIHDYSESDFAAWLANYESSWEYSGGALIRWESRIVTIAAYLLPRKTREEWLGDLQESIHELIQAGRPRWMRTLITSGRICLLCYALAWIKICDLVSPAKRSRR